MMYDRLSDRVLDKVHDALTRGLALGEIVDCVDFSMGLATTEKGPQMVGLIYISVKSPVIGATIDACQIVLNVIGLSQQSAVDEQVRLCLEAIRTQKSQVLAGTNGHQQLSQAN